MLIDRQGVYIVAEKIEGDLGWIFREQPVEDYGVDAHTEVREGDAPTGKLMGIQIKTGPSYFGEPTEGGFVLRPEARHVSYWTRHALPMILVLVDPSTKNCYWQRLDQETLVSTGKGWKVTVPKENLLDKGAKDKLLAVLAPNYPAALSQLQLAYPLMKLAEQKESFLLEAERWVNKSSGKTSARFLAGEYGKETVVQDWPFLILPGIDVIDFLQEAFPWASFELDDDFYDSQEEAQWESETGLWDYETDSYLLYSEDFQEWKEARGLTGLRPYETTEVAAFRFRVTLNELGKSYTVVENHLRNAGEPWLIFKEAPNPGPQADG